MKVVIAGLGKSGTTALLYQIRDAMPPDTLCLFEPKGYQPTEHKSVVAKILINRLRPVAFETFSAFDKKILIVRDPRDNVVSRLLYKGFNVESFWKNERKVARFLSCLKRKQARPRSLSMLKLIGALSELVGEDPRRYAHSFFTRVMENGLQFHEQFPDYFVVRYEDFVEGKVSSLESYLGLVLAKEAAVPDTLRRVVRTKAHGDWKNWFLPEDVAYFRPVLAGYMQRYGYPDDWELSAHPRIPPEHGAEYVRRLVNEVRSKNGLSPVVDPWLHRMLSMPFRLLRKGA